MKYYIELTLIENSKGNLYSLWSRIFTQIHLAFVERKDKNNRIHYGISFPNYFFNERASIGVLGDKIRIFAETKEELFLLALPKWLDRLSDYVHIQSIKEVPNKIEGYVKYQRYQSKGDSRLEKERRGYAEHYAQQNSVSIEEALSRYSHWERREVNFPYIQMKSLHSNKKFTLFIRKEIVEENLENCSNQLFTTYGLSAGGVVPEF
ncbi:type I-F CRISPR-associated endoribonuclease Cas6/Csy4 [Ignatzschineria sp. F8392]|uniref:type I-F CRISPR-associated endoribonuclease Cas6/Csy4 n=1 Tax=Ignatzschineria sp. F8392 TaxID=1980117 RepID=UPI000B9993E5|nr:type I-F CRISPR-associated endoribonuclease Cas6/Csy4 [Ignatzschineria sp. F8392]OYQ78804.1 type I-F CRISPR-associated endoribonuclease Cas6/Csy4 [Ignatzschineria sp. F8392]